MLFTKRGWKDNVKETGRAPNFLVTSYSLLLNSERRLEGEGDRNGALTDVVFIYYYLLFTKGGWKEKVKETERPPFKNKCY